MSFRILKFASVYPSFAQQFLRGNPDIPDLRYAEIHRRLVGTHYAQADYFSRHFRAFGHEAEDIFATVEPLQKAWARENGFTVPESDWVTANLLAQIERFAPDVVYMQDVHLLNATLRQRVRARIGKRILLLGWMGVPIGDVRAFRDVDFMLACVPNFKRDLEAAGIAAHLLPLAFEERILEETSPRLTRDLPFTFVGSLINSPGFHSHRYSLVEHLLEETPLELWGEITDTRPARGAAAVVNSLVFRANRLLSALGLTPDTRSRIPFVRRGTYWLSPPGRPPLVQRFPSRIHEPVFGRAYFDLLARSRIVFNSHIDSAEQYAGNMRLFEATGMGACVLTDAKRNLHELFEPDREVVVYRSAPEAAEKARYLLAHPDECRRIGEAGQRRTLREHTYRDRVARLIQLIEARL